MKISKQNMLTTLRLLDDLKLVNYILSQLNSRGPKFVMKALNLKDKNHCVPFIAAVASDSEDIVMHLLVSRLSNRNDFGAWFADCPLTIACSNRSLEMLMILIEPDYHTNYDINRALVEIVARIGISDSQDAEIIQLLIEAGANPFAPLAIEQMSNKYPVNNIRLTQHMHLQRKILPLAVAACSGNIEAVKAMLNSYTLM